ncbi:MAG: cytochrome C [Cyclobacteriaceae bacterium]
MSKKEDLNKLIQLASKLVNLVLVISVLVSILVIYTTIDPGLMMFKTKPESISINTTIKDEIENGIHMKTGLIEAEGLMMVVNNCTNCHSSKLILQNRMNAERWNTTIKWMQETQNLWDLGVNQEVIVNYLVTNYPPESKGRREKLANIEWYDLEN